MLLIVLVFVFLFDLSAPERIKDCSSSNCIILDDNDLIHLLQQSVLTKPQVDYLQQYYSTKVNINIIEPDIDDTTTPIHSKADANDDLDANITAYNVVKTFVSTANLLYCCGCFILTVAYITLIYWFRADSPYIQILLTLIYHYIFHIIANLLSHTLSSRILSAILYICCCNMPTIALFIYLFHPKLANGYGLLRETYDRVNSVFVHNINNDPINIARWDVFFVDKIPTQIFVFAILLCLSSMITPFIYAFVFQVGFIGIFGVFTATLYVLVIILGLFSLRSDIINYYMACVSKSCIYGDCRCIYVSILYWISMFITAYLTENTMLCIVCLISGLNAFCWSFPLVLFIDIFRPNININWDILIAPNNHHMIVDGANVILSLLQQRSMRYRAFIMTNIVMNWFILQCCIQYSTWIAVPYSVFPLFCLSYTVKADMKWSVLIHIPIAYALFKACFAYIHIVDIETLNCLSWIAPQNILLWIITTILRSGTSLVASLQITRALYWITIPQSMWDNADTSIADIATHSITLYMICNVFLYFTYLEPNVFISFVFEVFGICYGATLVLSMAQIFAAKRRPWALFVLNIVIQLRFYILCDALILPRILAFLGSFVGFGLLHSDGVLKMRLDRDIHVTMAVVLGIIFYSVFGLLYDCKLFILTAVIILCGYVSYKVWEKTQSKRAALIALSLLAVVLIQIGLRFEMGSFNNLLPYKSEHTVDSNDDFRYKAQEITFIDYFVRIFF